MVSKKRIVRDPIYGFISLHHYDFIRELIDTPYFQRLRRLSQLGVSPYVYPTATHTRLSHSIGAMELFVRLVDNLFEHESKEREKIGELRALGIATIPRSIRSIPNKSI